jgi:hypothetical protein
LFSAGQAPHAKAKKMFNNRQLSKYRKLQYELPLPECCGDCGTHGAKTAFAYLLPWASRTPAGAGTRSNETTILDEKKRRIIN